MKYVEWLWSLGSDDTGKIVLTAFGPILVAFLAAFFTNRLAIGREKAAEDRKRARTEKYAAALLCSSLDLFINESLDAADDDEGIADGVGFRQPVTPYPTLSYAKEVDWTCLDEDLMSNALRLVAELDSGRRAVQFTADRVSFKPLNLELFEERVIRVSQLGLRASMLLDDLKMRYSVSTQERGAVNLVEHFNMKIFMMQDVRKRRKADDQKQQLYNSLGR